MSIRAARPALETMLGAEIHRHLVGHNARGLRYRAPVPTALADITVLYLLVLFAAVLYSSGGHAGASAYLAIMSLYGLAPAMMRPTALVMNIAVAAIGTVRFARARAVPWSSAD